MKILAIEKEIDGVNWKDTEKILASEARHVYELYLASTLREIYFTNSRNAVLILEATNKEEAMKLLHELPLVKNGLIHFDIHELHPYTGLNRILKDF